MPHAFAKSLLALTAISAVHAHTVFTGLYVNGVGLVRFSSVLYRLRRC